MLHDLDKTLEKLIMREGNIPNGEIDVLFDPPTGEWASRLSRPTLNCWCFDLRENLKLRSVDRSMERMNGNMSRMTFAPRRIDLMYLVTAWTRKAEDEHQLLWRALAVLKRFTTLEPKNCEGDLRYLTLPIPLTVADMTTANVNLVDLWSVLENQMHLGFTVMATVELDTKVTFETPLVLEATLRVGEPGDLKGKRTRDLKIRPRKDQEKEDEGENSEE
jgi:Pvc16 N-terminal domain